MNKLLLSLLSLSLTAATPAFSLILLDREMTPEEQRKTGISKLSEQEQRHLEEWLNDTFVKQSDVRPEAFSEEIYVSEVINGGQQLQLSNNTVYEIAPEDWAQAQAWIALTKVKVIRGKDAYYPYVIINPRSGYRVRARLVDVDRPDPDKALHELEGMMPPPKK